MGRGRHCVHGDAASGPGQVKWGRHQEMKMQKIWKGVGGYAHCDRGHSLMGPPSPSKPPPSCSFPCSLQPAPGLLILSGPHPFLPHRPSSLQHRLLPCRSFSSVHTGSPTFHSHSEGPSPSSYHPVVFTTERIQGILPSRGLHYLTDPSSSNPHLDCQYYLWFLCTTATTVIS